MTVLSSREILRDIKGSLPGHYEKRLKVNLTHKGVGRMSMFFYLMTGGRRHIIGARNLGRAMGLNIRLVDDLIDGDINRKVENRGKFFEKYIDCFYRGAEHDYVDVEEEELAYSSGRTFYRFLSDFPEVHLEMKNTMEEIASKLENEDKTTEKGYREYVVAAGGDLGEACVELLQVLPDYELSGNKREFAREIGATATVADDIADNDLPLSDEFLESELEKHYKNLRTYNSKIVRFLTFIKPEYIRWSVRTHERINSFLF